MTVTDPISIWRFLWIVCFVVQGMAWSDVCFCRSQIFRHGSRVQCWGFQYFFIQLLNVWVDMLKSNITFCLYAHANCRTNALKRDSPLNIIHTLSRFYISHIHKPYKPFKPTIFHVCLFFNGRSMWTHALVLMAQTEAIVWARHVCDIYQALSHVLCWYVFLRLIQRSPITGAFNFHQTWDFCIFTLVLYVYWKEFWICTRFNYKSALTSNVWKKNL